MIDMFIVAGCHDFKLQAYFGQEVFLNVCPEVEKPDLASVLACPPRPPPQVLGSPSFPSVLCSSRQRHFHPSLVTEFTATSSFRTRPQISPPSSPRTSSKPSPSTVCHLPYPSSIVDARQTSTAGKTRQTLPSSSSLSPPPRLAPF